MFRANFGLAFRSSVLVSFSDFCPQFRRQKSAGEVIRLATRARIWYPVERERGRERERDLPRSTSHSACCYRMHSSTPPLLSVPSVVNLNLSARLRPLEELLEQPDSSLRSLRLRGCSLSLTALTALLLPLEYRHSRLRSLCISRNGLGEGVGALNDGWTHPPPPQQMLL